MLLKLTIFELSNALKNRTNYFYFLSLFLIGFVLIHAAAGFFDFFKLLLVGESSHLNGARLIGAFLSFFRIFLVLIVAATVSALVFADFKYNTLSMTFTSGVPKTSFIFSKLIAAIIIAALIMSGAVFGHITASAMPYLDRSFFNDFNALFYFEPFIKNYLLNILLMTSVFLTFTMLFRSSLINWVLVVIFYAMNIVSTFYFADIDTSWLGAMIDPTGGLAERMQAQGLSAEQLDNNTLKLEGVYLYNRLMWLAIGISSLFLTLIKFDFQYQTSYFNFRKSIKIDATSKNIPTQSNFGLENINKTTPEAFKSSKLNIWLGSYLVEFKFISYSIHFLLTVIVGIALLLITSSSTGNMYETASYPITFEMVGLISTTFDTLLVFFIVLMTGELVWRERTANCNEIHDALPISSLIPSTSKILALLSTIAVFFTLFIIAGMAIQASRDYFDFELGQYITSVFGLLFIDYALFAVLAFFIHSLINNKYLAVMILLIYYFSGALGANIFEHNLISFGGAPRVIYSDLNGYGNNLFSFIIFKFYWFIFSLILLLLLNLIWIRGEILNTRKRFSFLLKNIKQLSKPLTILTVLFLIIGTQIFYNTNKLNDYSSASEQELARVDYEKQFKKYYDLVSPEIVNVKVNMDIYPEKLLASGTVIFTLKNNGENSIRKIHLNYDDKIISNLKFSNSAQMDFENTKLDYYIYSLSKPLQVGDITKLTFDFTVKERGFSNAGSTTSINRNGTFFNSTSIFPSFGYNSDIELLGERLRKQYRLLPKALALSRDDELAVKSSIFGTNNHFTDVEVTISTSGEQTAFSAGNLIKQWRDNGRNYFQYKNAAKIQNFIPFVSGNYETKAETWQSSDKSIDPVDVSIHYHKTHQYNIDTIMESAKDSLSYYSSHFSPYAQKQLRIIEFPRTYGSFAQSFPSTIPFSESIGFLTDLRELNNKDVAFEDQKIDVAYFVTAHEIAHQWWAHQVSSANVEGVSFLIESLSEYSALKVMEKKYGKQKIKKFLRTERQRYLISRATETFEERPLARSLVSQQATFYNKGSLSLYALDNYLGSDVFDKVIQEFIGQFAYKSDPYPTSKDFVDLLMEYSPAKFHYFIDDHINKITFYSAEVNEAFYSRNENLEYQVDVAVNMKKFYSDAEGKETKVEMQDLIEIGIYNSRDKELLLQQIPMISGENTISLILPRKPSYIVIDPYYHIITKDFEIAKQSFVKK